MRLRLGELFAGYGGLGEAVMEMFDAELTWYAEYDDAPSKIMAHHYPGITNYGDVTTVNWAEVQPVDIISGGSPCQDVSAAGRRAGMKDGTRSNLWVAQREAIATIRPRYAIWENVRGALSAKASSAMESAPGYMGNVGKPALRAAGRVLGDLAGIGYDAEWRVVRAGDKTNEGIGTRQAGAPHQRERVFVLAKNTDFSDSY